MTQLIIFTDLDGTLLDHHSYSFEAASEALAEIKSRDYPLVLISSKTAAEIQDIQQQLAIASPFISENGAAVYWYDKGSLKSQVFAPTRKQLLATIHALRLEHDYQFVGFADCTTESIVGMTGLDLESAGRAANRRDGGYSGREMQHPNRLTHNDHRGFAGKCHPQGSDQAQPDLEPVLLQNAAAIASARLLTVVMAKPSIICLGWLAFGIIARLKPRPAASFKRSSPL